MRFCWPCKLDFHSSGISDAYFSGLGILSMERTERCALSTAAKTEMEKTSRNPDVRQKKNAMASGRA